MKEAKALTRREREIYDLLIQNFSNKEIAEKLCLAVPTVQSHKMHIYKKLQVTNIAQLLNHGVEHVHRENNRLKSLVHSIGEVLTVLKEGSECLKCKYIDKPLNCKTCPYLKDKDYIRLIRLCQSIK